MQEAQGRERLETAVLAATAAQRADSEPRLETGVSAAHPGGSVAQGPGPGLRAFQSVASGAAAGAFGKLVVYPMDTVKKRLQVRAWAAR